MTRDFIAIDTNIFEHLLNPEEDTDEHIDELLSALSSDKIKLLVDSKNRIRNEYKNRLQKRIREAEDQHPQKRRLLFYWLTPKNHNPVAVEFGGELMTKIKAVMPSHQGKPNTDLIFVYVAFKEDRVLITNDRKDIIDEGDSRDKRRKKLLGMPRKFKPSGADILTSKEAYARLQ